VQLVVVAFLGAVSGCYSGFDSTQAQLHFDPADTLVTEPFAGLVPDHTLLLEGTEVCATLRCSDADSTCPESIDIAACFAPSVEGGSVSGDLCAIAETPGTFVWHFDPVVDVASCGADPATYTPTADEVSFEVVSTTEVRPVLLQWAERGAEEALVPAGDAFPDDWMVEEGEPFQVVAGGRLQLPVAFLTSDDDRIVAWDSNEVFVEVVTNVGDNPDVSMPQPGVVAITPTLGSVNEVFVTVRSDTWVAGTVVGVSPEDVASLEIVVALLDDDGHASPFGARAVLRDADGALVYGAPVTWRLIEGNVLLDSDADSGMPGADYVGIRDACVAALPDVSDPRSATIEASYGGLTSTATFDWVVPASTGEFFPDSECAGQPNGDATEEGCACDQSGVPGMGIAALVGWLARRRRKTH
jgi:hypothetical protein